MPIVRSFRNKGKALLPLKVIKAAVSAHQNLGHPGVLDAKVGYFDPKSAKVHLEERLTPQTNRLNAKNGPESRIFDPFFFTLTKRSLLRGPTKCAKVGPPRARVKSAKVRPTPYV